MDIGIKEIHGGVGLDAILDMVVRDWNRCEIELRKLIWAEFGAIVVDDLKRRRKVVRVTSL